MRLPRPGRGEVRETELGGSLDLLDCPGPRSGQTSHRQERTRSAVSVQRATDNDMAVCPSHGCIIFCQEIIILPRSRRDEKLRQNFPRNPLKRDNFSPKSLVLPTPHHALLLEYPFLVLLLLSVLLPSGELPGESEGQSGVSGSARLVQTFLPTPPPQHPPLLHTDLHHTFLEVSASILQLQVQPVEAGAGEN